MVKAATRRGFGSVRRLPSKRWQASYVGPDLCRHPAPQTFATKGDAEAWLGREHQLVTDPGWRAPGPRAQQARQRGLIFEDFARSWLRERQLRPRTVEGYEHLMKRYLLPTFGQMAVGQLTPALVRTWWSKLDATTPTVNVRAYKLLKSICATAVEDEVLAANPCRLRMRGSSERAKDVKPATPAELVAAADAMPPNRQLLVLLAAWCALRRGEILELRRSDIDLDSGTLSIRRAVQWIGSRVIVGSPKTSAGIRMVAIPPHLLPAIHRHLDTHVGPMPSALLFVGRDEKHLSPTALQGSWSRARHAAGRDDLRFHDLRHTGATMAAMSGATLAELQARLGHSSVNAALRYQHAVQGRDAQIAAALSKLAETEAPTGG